jgi:hypothetical protein
MDIIADAAGAVFAELPENAFQVLKPVAFGAKKAEVVIALVRFLLHDNFHIGTVVTVESIPFDRCGFNALAFKNAIEGLFD